MASADSSVGSDVAAPAAIVTGATSGIGLEIARGLATRGIRTVLVGRGVERVADVARSIRHATGNPSVESLGVRDLALRSEVRALAHESLERFPKIGMLVNNAGAMYVRRELTSEGTERTLALNVLAPFLLTALLVPRLIESRPARVVNIASAAHRGNSVRFEDLQGTGRYRGFGAYGKSKLELILLTREFARRLAGTGVTVNAVHPGFVRSGFGRNNRGGTAATIRAFAVLFGKTPRQGAETPLFVATDPTVAAASGQYFTNGHASPGSAESRKMSDARRLYEICRDLTGAPEIPEASTESSGSAGSP